MSLPESQRFASKLGRKSFLVTMEVNPPKGTDLTDLLAAVERVRDLLDAVNVTDGSGAIMRASALAVAKAVLDAGADPILQMTCRDRNRLALQADLLGAAVLGIRNVLLLTGDDPVLGWLEGTTLRPALDRLQDERRDAFLSECARRLREAYPPGPAGTVFPFRRLFVVALMAA